MEGILFIQISLIGMSLNSLVLLFFAKSSKESNDQSIFLKNIQNITVIDIWRADAVNLNASQEYEYQQTDSRLFFCVRLIYLTMHLSIAVGILERRSQIGAICVLLFLLIVLTDASWGVNQNELREWKKVWYKTELQITWSQRASTCRGWKRIRSRHRGNEPPW